jgi:hypothetical protein
MIEIAIEPADAAYDDLLRLAFDECDNLSLVTRPGLTFGASAHATLDALAPYSIDRLAVNKWPGTDLLNSEATLHRFRTTPAALEVLRRPRRLYAWQAPDYPEDLAFYTADGGVWLGSCAHEAFAFLEAVTHTVDQLGVLLPRLYLRQRSGRGAV